MKKYFAILIFAVLLSACDNGQETKPPKATTTTEPAPTTKPATPTTTKNPDGTVHVKSSYGAFLVGTWFYGYAFGSENKTEDYKGRWIQFKRDDTFISGIYDQQTNQGTFTYDHENKQMITINYEKEEPIFNQWKIQRGQYACVWKGNTPLNNSGIQIKMEQQNPNDRPKKE